MFKDKYLNRCKEPIKSHFIYVNFILWLQRNESRFLVKPYIRRIYKESFVVGFKNVENISVHFDLSGFVTIPELILIFLKKERETNTSAANVGLVVTFLPVMNYGKTMYMNLY